MELFVVQGPDSGRSFAVGAQAVLGRDPTAAIHLTDDEVSRRHALISAGDGRVVIEDLGSSNGTFIDGRRVGDEAELQVGARLRVGQSVLELRATQGVDPEDLPATKVPFPVPERE